MSSVQDMLSLLLKPWVASHRETQERLSDYVDGELDARTRTRVIRHLARCGPCRAVLESLQRTLDELRSIGGVEQAAPAGTVDAVLRRVRHDEL